MEEFELFSGTDYELLRPYRYIIDPLLAEIRKVHPDCSFDQKRAELLSEAFHFHKLFLVGAAQKLNKMEDGGLDALAELTFKTALMLSENTLSCFPEVPAMWRLSADLTPEATFISRYLEITCRREADDMIQARKDIGGKSRVRDDLYHNIEVYFKSTFRNERLDKLMLILAIEAEAEPFLHEMLHVDIPSKVSGVTESPYERALLVRDLNDNFGLNAVKGVLKYSALYVLVVLIWISFSLPVHDYAPLLSLVIFLPFVVSTLTLFASLRDVDQNQIPNLVESMSKLITFVHTDGRLSLLSLEAKLEQLRDLGASFPPQVKLAFDEIKKSGDFL